MPQMSDKLDKFDRSILQILQVNGRATNQEVADTIGLSASPCLRRIKKLEADAIIKGYTALVDPEALGLSVSAFVRVRLDQQDDRHLALFEQAIGDFEEIMECYLMSGEADYQLRVQVESLGAFETFLRHKLTRVAGVSQVTSSFALRPVVYKTALPVA